MNRFRINQWHGLAGALFRTLLSLLIVAVLPGLLWAQVDVEDTQNPGSESAEPNATWLPPGLVEDDLDWVRLSSGEWIRGNIEHMRDGKLEFDSEDLGTLVIDWEDVAGLYAPTVNRYALEDSDVVFGAARMEDGVITVQTAAGPQSAPAGSLLAILEGEPNERNRWSFKFSFGLNATLGNSEQAGITASARIVREDANTRLALDYNGALGFSRDERTINNNWGAGKLDWFATRDFFLTLVQGSAGHDEFRNLGLQANVGVGLGYTLIDSEVVDWDVTLVGAWVYTRFASVPEGGDDVQTGGAVIPATRLDVETRADIDFGASHQSVLVVSNFGLSYYRTTGYLSFELTDILDFDVSAVWDRVRQPVQTADGKTPNKDTLQLLVGFGLDF